MILQFFCFLPLLKILFSSILIWFLVFNATFHRASDEQVGPGSYGSWICLPICLFVCLMVFNTTFNNISAISCWSVLLVEETRGFGENHWPVASDWQTLRHNVVHLSLISWVVVNPTTTARTAPVYLYNTRSYGNSTTRISTTVCKIDSHPQ